MAVETPWFAEVLAAWETLPPIDCYSPPPAIPPWRALVPQDIARSGGGEPGGPADLFTSGDLCTKASLAAGRPALAPDARRGGALMLLWSTNAVLDHLALSRQADAAQEASRAFYRQWFKNDKKRYQPAPADAAAAPPPAGSDNRRLTAGRPYSQLANMVSDTRGFSCGR